MPESRKAIVASVLSRFSTQIDAPEDSIDEIGRRLLPHIIDAMPAEDAGNWGVLQKPNKIPYDVLVWKPTLEHFDVMSSAATTPGNRRLQPVWINNGTLPDPSWVWKDWRSAGIVPLGESPVPQPNPEPTPTPQPQPQPEPCKFAVDDQLRADVNALRGQIAALQFALADAMETITKQIEAKRFPKYKNKYLGTFEPVE